MATARLPPPPTGPHRSRPPSPYRSLAAPLHVTKQNPPSLEPGSAPLCPPPDPPPPERKGPPPHPPARCRIPPRGGHRRSPKVPRPPAAAASRTPRPGLLVQQQLRLLGRRRHLSLCGKTRPFGWSGASLGRSSPGPSAAGRVPPQLLPPPSVPSPPEPGRPTPGREGRGGGARLNPTREDPPKLTVWCRVRQTGATLGARGVPASHAALYAATRLQRPPSAPRFSPPASVPTAQARGFPASAWPRAAGGDRRGAPGRSGLRGRVGWGAAGTVHRCSRVPEKPNKVTSPSGDLITPKEVPAPK